MLLPLCSKGKENEAHWGHIICQRSLSKLVRLPLFQCAFHQTMLNLKGHAHTLVSKSELQFAAWNQVTNGEIVFGYYVVGVGRKGRL